MKKWILKAIVQKTISYLPFSNNINYLFQKYVTKGVYLNADYFTDRLQHAAEHLHFYSKYTGKSFPETTLELGTGWYPVVPISFFLCGTEKIYTVDIALLTNKERIKTTIEQFLAIHKSGKLQQQLPIIDFRFKQLETLYNTYETLSFKEIIAQLNITYLIEDARQLSLPDNSIDLVNSNNTYEHIYPEILSGIMKDFKRVVKKDTGIQSHFIDMSDHFAHFDKSINIYNFLKFNDAQWQYIDNSIQPQSRLRYSEYKALYRQLNIDITEETTRPGDLNALQAITLAAKYKSMPINEVAISHSHFVSKK
jgi:ubiquinone/menaquinone biosynthesis C-methylase UbiE